MVIDNDFVVVLEALLDDLFSSTPVNWSPLTVRVRDETVIAKGA